MTVSEGCAWGCADYVVEVFSTDTSLTGTTVPVTIHAVYTNSLSQVANSVALAFDVIFTGPACTVLSLSVDPADPLYGNPVI